MLDANASMPDASSTRPASAARTLGLAAVAFAAVAALPAAGPLSLAPVTAAQPAGGQAVNSLPGNVRNADNAREFTSQIDAFVSSQAQALSSGGPDASAARGRIVDQVAGDVSNSFRDEYARALNDALGGLDLAAMEPFPRVNVAIAVEGVARATGNPRLIPVIEKLVKDDSPGVALWGIKAARYVIGESMRQSPPGREPLSKAVLAAVETHSRRGPIAEDGYRALQLRLLDNDGAQVGDLTLSRGVPQVVPASLDILKLRLAMYGPTDENDVEEDVVRPLPPRTPPSPRAENEVMRLVAYPTVWPRQDANLQKRTVGDLRQALVILRDARILAQESVNAPDIDTATRDQRSRLREEIATVMNNTANTLQAIASAKTGAPANSVSAAAQELTKQPIALQPDALRTLTQNLVDAIGEEWADLPPLEDVNFAGDAEEGEPAADEPTDEAADEE